MTRSAVIRRRARPDTSTVFLFAWHLARRLPEGVVRGLMELGARAVWAADAGGVRQLRANLRRARPDAGPHELRRLTLEGMRTYLRYFGETFVLGRLHTAQVDARVRAVGTEAVREHLGRGASVVLALGHQGNWDLAGAWATRHVAPVTTVAERLEPPEVFEEFVRLREGIGIRIIPLDGGSEVFRELSRTVRAGGSLVPLLADRDLTARGVEVDLLGERARVAAGPAALAVSTGSPLVPTTIRHERLHGDRRRRAGSRWGVVITFHAAVRPPDAAATRAEQVAAMTQGWVDVVGADIAAHPTHWHMLQKVFVADLDPERYARTAAAGEST